MYMSMSELSFLTSTVFPRKIIESAGAIIFRSLQMGAIILVGE